MMLTGLIDHIWTVKKLLIAIVAPITIKSKKGYPKIYRQV